MLEAFAKVPNPRSPHGRRHPLPAILALSVAAMLSLTLVTFTLANAFRTARGQKLAGHGVRRQRAEEESGKVIVFAGEHDAIFDIEEVFILLGIVPEHCLRANPTKVRRRYGLPSAA